MSEALLVGLEQVVHNVGSAENCLITALTNIGLTDHGKLSNIYIIVFEISIAIAKCATYLSW